MSASKMKMLGAASQGITMPNTIQPRRAPACPDCRQAGGRQIRRAVEQKAPRISLTNRDGNLKVFNVRRNEDKY